MLLRHLQHRERLTPLEQVLLDDLCAQQARDDHCVEVGVLLVEIEDLLSGQHHGGLEGIHAVLHVITLIYQRNDALLLRSLLQVELAALDHALLFVRSDL